MQAVRLFNLKNNDVLIEPGPGPGFFVPVCARHGFFIFLNRNIPAESFLLFYQETACGLTIRSCIKKERIRYRSLYSKKLQAMKRPLLSLFAGIAIAGTLSAQPPRVYDTTKSSAVNHTASRSLILPAEENMIHMSIALSPAKKSKQKKNRTESPLGLVVRKTD